MMKWKLDEEDRIKALRRQEENKPNKSVSPARKKRKQGDDDEDDEEEVVIMSIKNVVGGWEGLGPPPVV